MVDDPLGQLNLHYRGADASAYFDVEGFNPVLRHQSNICITLLFQCWIRQRAGNV